MNENKAPNQGGSCSERQEDYLRKAADACEAGDLVLGMHLYLAAYEKAAADPAIPDGMGLEGLHEAWHLACDLRERSMAEYVFEKLEPYLSSDERAECAEQLQELALDRLEQIGFSREELQGMAEMISQDIVGSDAQVVKVESISIPNSAMFGVPDVAIADVQIEAAVVDDDPVQEGAPTVPADASGPAPEGIPDQSAPSDEPAETPVELNFGLADVQDFNPYDEYRDYSIGKSYHAATNEGAGAAVFSRDAERMAAHDEFVSGEAKAEDAGESRDQDDGAGRASDAQNPVAAEGHAVGEGVAPNDEGASRKLVRARPDTPDAPASAAGRRRSDDVFDYGSLAGYGKAISIVRDLGIGLQGDRGYLDFVAMLNERHGLDRAPALDTLLLRSPAIEDASRFVEATIGEIGLPSLRMSIEENVQGMPLLCVTTQGNNRPRMNHAHNRFEAPAILVLEDLDMWSVPEMPEGVEGMGGFVMANMSRGAREAVNLIRASVEDPDVFVLVTATTSGDVDPFYYDLLEPMTIVDIGYPDDDERNEIWMELARDHPSIRSLNRADLIRFSANMPRYDIYMAARAAVEEAYKLGLVRRDYVPVTPQNMFEKLAACQPLDSDAYREIEDEVIRGFQEDLRNLEQLLEEPRD